MSNKSVFTYQHTCKLGHKAYILKSAPFKSSIVKRQGKPKYPFLGEGYYLWEENLEAAIRWGSKRYGNDYAIVEYEDLEIENEDLLDFLNRRHTKYFEELKIVYEKRIPKSRTWKLGQWIEFFKQLNQKEKGIFPFTFIRAEENLPIMNENDKVKRKIFFAEGLDYFTFLSPLLILCVIDKRKMNFQEQRFIHHS